MATYYAAESFSWYSRDLLKQACTPLSFHNLFMTPASSVVIKPSSAAPASTKSWRASSCTFDRTRGVRVKGYKWRDEQGEKRSCEFPPRFFIKGLNFSLSKAPLAKLAYAKRNCELMLQASALWYRWQLLKHLEQQE